MSLPAFPGAEGFGSTTIGGRGGVVLHVNNLLDSGVGSWRWAINYPAPRIIVFDVYGTITNLTPIKITDPFFTVAGQSAPGEGITFAGEETRVQTHDGVFRHCRFRSGDVVPPVDNWDNRDALNFGAPNNLGGTYNIILDHCSLSWSVDECCTVWFASHDITIQYCIISEPLWHSFHPKGAHSMTHLFGAADVSTFCYNISSHHNLLIDGNERNPQFAFCDMVDFRCNVVYNWGTAAAELEKGGQKRINFINNYYLKGPNSGSNVSCMQVRNDALLVELYIAGNIDQLVSDPNANNWVMVRDYSGNQLPENANGHQFRLFQPFATPKIRTQPALTCATCLPKCVGATRPYRDDHDTRVINEFLNNRGAIIDSTAQVGGWETMQPGSVPLDTDQDGMPDSWEDSHGLNKNDAGDASGDRDGDGYTNIEEYLNALAA